MDLDSGVGELADRLMIAANDRPRSVAAALAAAEGILATTPFVGFVEHVADFMAACAVIETLNWQPPMRTRSEGGRTTRRAFVHRATVPSTSSVGAPWRLKGWSAKAAVRLSALVGRSTSS